MPPLPSPKLAGVHPDLVRKVHTILGAMAARGYPMIVTDGVRTAQQQIMLYAKGRSAPGRIVTHADGLKKRSNHQVRLPPSLYAGFGCAVDCCFLDEKGRPTWDIRYPWADYGAEARALGLVWGGDWKALRDMPHIELPEELTP